MPRSRNANGAGCEFERDIDFCETERDTDGVMGNDFESVGVGKESERPNPPFDGVGSVSDVVPVSSCDRFVSETDAVNSAENVGREFVAVVEFVSSPEYVEVATFVWVFVGVSVGLYVSVGVSLVSDEEWEIVARVASDDMEEVADEVFESDHEKVLVLDRVRGGTRFAETNVTVDGVK